MEAGRRREREDGRRSEGPQGRQVSVNMRRYKKKNTRLLLVSKQTRVSFFSVESLTINMHRDKHLDPVDLYLFNPNTPAHDQTETHH